MYINETVQKKTVQTIQDTVNTGTHITKTPTHTHTHTLQNTHIHQHIIQVKTTTVQDTQQMKESQYN
jgi:hypothetical protein